ncbi:GL25530 [Drosophila persimilis]|uniref:Protein adenylyltransferase Fic n=2 Tax=pseudoobscura subgroup TaxID=32358 RepID=FICD_DROPS|nr:adenosine monophosphate-protein transferase Fic [Drosophila persimilis]B4GJC1.1 RecName: Full=Protein adenylyltransferase Fic; AltName: Full=De-AMPylase Fic [Drosophila persimilis]Q29JP8.2 RecName: Full=Protein adenylyltransferase Fic; AltName: Full=De-AMPylase Fic [Drosophila pseudoobscura pseudoobscura]EDW37435.1 GL25530 [Drosophila persimilis]
MAMTILHASEKVNAEAEATTCPPTEKVKEEQQQQEQLQHSKTSKRVQFYRFALFFIAGSFAAFSFHALTSSSSWRLRQLHHLPNAHYLQTREEFAVYSVEELNAFKEFYDKSISDSVGASYSEAEQTNIKEALGALRLAQDMHLSGKDDKASRLFEHALALAPKHPEVLLRYGEFLEHNQRNIVLADQYYFQALTLCPSNSEALANRQRTAEVVQTLDERRLQSLDSKRDALSAIHESSSALRRAKKEAYFQHIYHSVGIEGNTMTLAQTRSILETRMAVDGKSIDEHNEILGMDLAMKYINASLVQKLEITIKDILELHRRVLGHVDPIEGGEFRRNQVYVGGHVPPGPGDLALLMQRFERWLNSEHSSSLHPVNYAAYAHYKLVHIHPFIDGNGRTSRLLMNTLLMRAGYPPVIIPKQQRSKYYHFLKLANEGDIRPFVRFIADCTEKTLDLYLWATSDLPQQIPMLIQTESEAGEQLAQMRSPHISAQSASIPEFYEFSGSGFQP